MARLQLLLVSAVGKIPRNDSLRSAQREEESQRKAAASVQKNEHLGLIEVGGSFFSQMHCLGALVTA